MSVREVMSGTTCALFTKFFVHVAYVRGSVSCSMFTIGRIADQPEGVFFPIENALSAGKGGWQCTARVKCAVYDFLVFVLLVTVSMHVVGHRKK